MNLLLIGYRGSGKSTVGAIVARRLGWPFVDLDELIAKAAGCSIADIFRREGEAGFRRRELEACEQLKKLQDHVISLGGGVADHPETRALVKRAGRIVWLRAPAAVLWSRISRDPASSRNRPDLTPQGGLAEVEAVLARREPLYQNLASHVVDSFNVSPDEVAESVELWFQADDADGAT